MVFLVYFYVNYRLVMLKSFCLAYEWFNHSIKKVFHHFKNDKKTKQNKKIRGIRKIINSRKNGKFFKLEHPK